MSDKIYNDFGEELDPITLLPKSKKVDFTTINLDGTQSGFKEELGLVKDLPATLDTQSTFCFDISDSSRPQKEALLSKLKSMGYDWNPNVCVRVAERTVLSNEIGKIRFLLVYHFNSKGEYHICWDDEREGIEYSIKDLLLNDKLVKVNYE